MKKLLTSKRMQEIDAYTSTQFQLSSLVLMERAALCTVQAIEEAQFDLNRIAVICGTGNNGGDGVAVARILKERNVSSDVFVIGDKAKLSSSLSTQIYTYEQYGVSVNYITTTELISTLNTSNYTLIVDALFGVGLNRILDDSYQNLIHTINELSSDIVSVDIPSGVNATDGSIMGAAVKSQLTVTYGYYKIGQYLYPGSEYCGKLILNPIGIVQDIEHHIDDVYLHDSINRRTRPAYSNKGTFGKLLIIAGSSDVAGALIMAAKSAFRSGVGMIKVITHERNRDLMIQELPEVMITTYQDKVPDLTYDLNWANVVAIGPGLSTGNVAKELLTTVLTKSTLPLVVDADAITLLAQNPVLLQKKTVQTLIITPHLGEFSRISGEEITDIKNHLIKSCRNFAEKKDLICVLKDSRTIISDGEHTYLNATGNCGMATAGSGDVLFGLIASLLAQGYSPLDAASIGCYIHGACGDLAVESSSQSQLIATDIISYYNVYLA